MPRSSQCRFCGTPLVHSFADLGMSPLANRYLTADQVNAMEPFFPLHALVCDRCMLVQLEEFETPDAIFSDYAYFSSFSSSWLEHCRNYAEMAVDRFRLGAGSHVVELASNDGYLLQYFADRGVPVLGVEPAANVAKVAEQERGIPTVVEFFGRETGEALAGKRRADLLIGNNVLAHVPDLNDFVGGMKLLLADEGRITMEFPHVMRLVDDRQFDTIYHEHFSYFSFLTVREVFSAHELEIFDVDELPTHGGSLRIYARHAGAADPPSENVADLERREEEGGYRNLETYTEFAELVKSEKREILSSVIALKNDGATIVGYGAPAKGNTLLNYCGIGTDFVDYTVDRSPHKQGHYLPGTHIPIRAPEEIERTRPDVVFILPWNLREEIMDQLSYISDWGGRFLVRSPALELHA